MKAFVTSSSLLSKHGLLALAAFSKSGNKSIWCLLTQERIIYYFMLEKATSELKTINKIGFPSSKEL